MSSVDEILASLGVSAGVGNPSSPLLETSDTPCQTSFPYLALALTLTPWVLLGLATFKFRRFWLQYFRDRIEYALSSRTDLAYELTYRMTVGINEHSIAMMISGTQRRELEDIPNRDVAGEESLEVVIE